MQGRSSSVIMLKISKAEQEYLIQGVEQGIRNDGRGRLDFRSYTLETGIISQANGSARLKLGMTDVLVGIKVEIGVPTKDRPNRGMFKFTVECCPSASPEFEGRGAEYLNVETAQLLERVMNNESVVDLKKLCIIPRVQCWVIFVDVLVLDSGGNLFDAVSMATRAALFDTAIPKVAVVPSSRAGESQIEVSDDPSDAELFDVQNVPVCITLSQIGKVSLIDASLEEELCMQSRLTVAVNSKGNFCTIQQGGSGGLSPAKFQEIIRVAKDIGLKLLDEQDTILACGIRST